LLSSCILVVVGNLKVDINGFFIISVSYDDWGEFLVLFIIAVGGGEARGIEVAVDEGEALELLLVYRLYHLGHDRRQDRILLRKLSVEIQCVLLVFLHTERIIRVITCVSEG
jgi:hypothetical protein